MRTMTKIGGCLALAAVMVTPVCAEISDNPYFNLWNGATTDANQSGGTIVQFCGVTTCLANSVGYGIFTTLPTNTGAGSGAIDPFLRFQHNEGDATGNATTEAAFNTSKDLDTGMIYNPNAGTANKGNLLPSFQNQAKDTVAGGPTRDSFNHAIRLGDLMVDDTTGLFTFRLDINEPGGAKATLRIDELQLFIANSNDLDKYTMDTTSAPGQGAFDDILTGQLAGGSSPGGEIAKKIWDMDFNLTGNGGTLGPGINGNKALGGVVLDSVLSSGPSNGSGDFDMALQVSSELFGYSKVNGKYVFTGQALGGGTYSEDSFVYLYNFMGSADKPDAAEAGFEEWVAVVDKSPSGCTTNCGGNNVPEPSTIFLAAAGLAGILRMRHARVVRTT